MRAAAEFVEGGGDEHVHDEAGLHVGNAGPVGALVFDRERAAGGFALAEHGVAMPHQQHRFLVAAGLCDLSMEGVAKSTVALTPGGNAVLGKMPLKPRT